MKARAGRDVRGPNVRWSVTWVDAEEVEYTPHHVHGLAHEIPEDHDVKLRGRKKVEVAGEYEVAAFLNSARVVSEELFEVAAVGGYLHPVLVLRVGSLNQGREAIRGGALGAGARGCAHGQRRSPSY